jgi:formylglycine-generating enzyme required for sulfatase activity
MDTPGGGNPGFWLGQADVTQEAYQRVTGNNPSRSKGANLPVESITWYEADAYCRAIGGRLPTENEWEYAARAATTGDTYGNLGDIAWDDGNSGGTTHPVAQKTPNAFGLYDMLGNVWQWTADWSDGTKKYKSLRGGSLNYRPGTLSFSYRNWNVPGHRISAFGFRCVGD